MKAISSIIAVTLIISHIVSCHKKPEVVPPQQDTICQITKMTFRYSSGSMLYTAIFKYNNKGNPVSMILPNGSGTGNPHTLFIYDQYDRLKDCISTYGSNTDPDNLQAVFPYEYWTRYEYADNNPLSLPVIDTFRMTGNYVNGSFAFTGLMRPDTLIYDSQRRIVPGRGLDVMGHPVTGNEYDANGNLMLPTVVYDNKKNFRTTNKIWMFVDKNYSKNNPFNAPAYSAYGYPTVFPQPIPPANALDFFLYKSRVIETMEYACSITSTNTNNGQ